MSMRELLIIVVLAACGSRTSPAPPAPAATHENATPTEQAPIEPTMSAPAGQADSGPCLKNEECASGVCEGRGCEPDEPGACAPKQRGCTRDRREYCGCDGVTFFASGSCPGKRFRAKGACPAGS